jgi:hypothetical protein
MSELIIDDQTGQKLLDILKREEKAVLSGEWQKLHAIRPVAHALVARRWERTPVRRCRTPLLRALRDQSELTPRLLAKALAEVGEKISSHRRRTQVSAAYRQVGTTLA